MTRAKLMEIAKDLAKYDIESLRDTKGNLDRVAAIYVAMSVASQQDHFPRLLFEIIEAMHVGRKAHTESPKGAG